MRLTRNAFAFFIFLISNIASTPSCVVFWFAVGVGSAKQCAARTQAATIDASQRVCAVIVRLTFRFRGAGGFQNTTGFVRIACHSFRTDALVAAFVIQTARAVCTGAFRAFIYVSAT